MKSNSLPIRLDPDTVVALGEAAQSLGLNRSTLCRAVLSSFAKALQEHECDMVSFPISFNLGGKPKTEEEIRAAELLETLEEREAAKFKLKELKLSYRKAAPLLGVTYQHLCWVLNGRRKSKSLLQAISDLPSPNSQLPASTPEASHA